MAVHWKEIDRLAQAHHSVDPTASEEDLQRQLQIWWCIKYTRPFKDPLLLNYTLNELVYEYLMWFYMDPNNDPLEKKRKEELSKADEEWALQQLRQMQPPKNKESQPEPKKKKAKKIKEPKKSSAAVQIPEPPEISTNFEE